MILDSTNGHLWRECSTPQWDESFPKHLCFAVVIVFWQQWAGYLAAYIDTVATALDKSFLPRVYPNSAVWVISDHLTIKTTFVKTVMLGIAQGLLGCLVQNLLRNNSQLHATRGVV